MIESGIRGGSKNYHSYQNSVAKNGLSPSFFPVISVDIWVPSTNERLSISKYACTGRG